MQFAVLLTWAALGFTEPLLTPEPEAQAPPRPKVEASKTPAAPLPSAPLPPIPAPPPPAKEAAKKPEAAPVLPPPRPADSKDAAKAPEAVPQPLRELPPLTPHYPAFADPRASAWTQHRLPPADLPCVELACQLQLCIKDHRCLREKALDYLTHWYCPNKLIFGKCCPENPDH
jgi:hypothetical protein